MEQRKVWLTGSVAGRFFVPNLIAAIKKKYSVYADVDEQDEFQLIIPNVKSIKTTDKIIIKTEPADQVSTGGLFGQTNQVSTGGLFGQTDQVSTGGLFGQTKQVYTGGLYSQTIEAPISIRSNTIEVHEPADVYAMIRLCTFSDVLSELSRLNTQIQEFRKRNGHRFLCLLHVKKPEDNIVAKAVEAALMQIKQPYWSLRKEYTCLFILGDADNQLSLAISRACCLILDAPARCAIKKMSISKFSDKPGCWIHGPKLPDHFRPALSRDQISTPNKDQPKFILTGLVEGRGFAPSFIGNVRLGCNLIVDVKQSSALKIFCPGIRSVHEVDRLLTNPPEVAGVIRICSDSENELDELQKDIDKYCPMIPQDVSGVFICICIICSQSDGVVAKAVQAHLANAHLQQTQAKDPVLYARAPIRFTSLFVLSDSETYLSEASSSVCLHLISAPPHVAITRISLQSFEDVPNDQKPPPC